MMLDELDTYSVKNFISFGEESYFRLFERQSEALWPAHPVLLILGAAAIVLAWLGKTRAVALCLAIALALSAVTYHLQLYAELSPVGRYFGWAFLLQAVFILLWGFASKALPKFRSGVPSVTGLGLAIFGFAVYPLLAPTIAERPWRGAEIFGQAPDPTICVVLGILLVCARPLWFLLLMPVPLLWCVVSGATIDGLEAPLAMVPPAIAVIAVLAAIWKAAFDRNSPPPATAAVNPSLRRDE